MGTDPHPDPQTQPRGSATHVRTCPLCEATCGLELSVEHDGSGGGEVRLVRGDRLDVFSAGYLCAKGSAIGRLHADPDRLRAPLVRRGTPDDPRFEEVSWDEAFATVEHLLTGVLTTHGRNASAIYLGNPNVHNPGAALYTRPLVRALATPNIFSASTVDQMPRHVSSGLMFGHPDAIAVPDLDRTDYLLMLGANPLESNGSLCTAPDFAGRLEAIRARGGKVVVVDPRRTRTAAVADEHVFIRPGTDAVLLVGLIHQLFATDSVDLGHLADWVTGIDDLRAHVAPFTPEHVEAVTGVGAEVVQRLAAELAAAPTAVVYGRIGTTTVAFGTVASWATDVLGVLTGNLDAPGGAMFPLAAHNRPGPGRGRGFSVGRRTSRVRGFPEVRGEFPVATLATEITTPGDGQVRALITVAGNPVLSTPDSAQLAAALSELECMVSVDPYLNETTRFAHVVLPPPSALQRCHYDLAFTGLSVRNVANFSPALFEPTGPPEHEILARLALIAAGQGANADPALIDALVIDALLARAVADDSPLAGRDPAELASQLTGDGPVERALDAMVRTGAYGDWFGAVPDGLSLQVLIDHPHGVDLGPLQPRIPEVLRTPSGTIELAPEAILADLGRLAAVRPAADADTDEALLVGRRHVRSNNSWMHNIEVLVKGRPRCTLQVHPDDAVRWGVTHGGEARVRSRVGEVVAQVECTDEVMVGVVSLPHGWGHDDPHTALGVASGRPGVNSNLLTDSEALDPLSGTSVLNGIPVRVSPAA